MSKQVQQFALFIVAVGAITSLVYHVLNWDSSTRQKAQQPVSKAPALVATVPGMTQLVSVATEDRKVLQVRPDDRSVQLGLARKLAHEGRYEEAVKEYRILLGEIK
jgi:hypothetical protein